VNLLLTARQARGQARDHWGMVASASKQSKSSKNLGKSTKLESLYDSVRTYFMRKS